jgi:hypothetical protein
VARGFPESLNNSQEKSGELFCLGNRLLQLRTFGWVALGLRVAKSAGNNIMGVDRAWRVGLDGRGEETFSIVVGGNRGMGPRFPATSGLPAGA